MNRIEGLLAFSATPSEAAPGETVSLCFESFPGYQSVNIKLMPEDGPLVPYRVTDRWQGGSIYRVWISFVMPEGNVQAELECVPHSSLNIARVQATGNGTVSHYRTGDATAAIVIQRILKKRGR